MPHSGLKPKNENYIWQKATFDGRRPLTEDNIRHKRTSDRRRPLMENDLWRKMTFDRRQLAHCWKAHGAGQNKNDPKEEDDLRWYTTFDGRQPLMEDELWWKTTFDGRRPLTEDDLWRNTTFDGRRPSIGCIVYYLKKMFTTPHLDSHSTADPKPEILSAV